MNMYFWKTEDMRSELFVALLNCGFLLNIIISQGLVIEKLSGHIVMDQSVTNTTSRVKIFGISLLNCTKECEERPACAALEYNRRSHLCSIYSHAEYTSARVRASSDTAHVNATKSNVSNSQDSVFLKCHSKETCIATGCSLPVISNGIIRGNLLWTGSKILLNCTTGFTAVNGTSAVCDVAGSWSRKLQCVTDILCDPPPNISNAVAENISGAQRRYECLPGYRKSGLHDVTTCDESGKWSSISITCLRLCYEPMVIPHTNLSKGQSTEGASRTYTCVNGYSTVNGTVAIEITCQADGNWTANEFQCYPNCGALPNIEKGKFTAGENTAGSRRQYVCDDDFALPDGSDTGTVLCNTAGEWEPNVTVTCELLDDPLGDFCMSDAACSEPNTTCFRSRCFCKPMYIYSIKQLACQENCSQVADTFTRINGTYIGWYWSDKVTLGQTDTCQSVCIANNSCLFYEHLHRNALDCRIGTLSLRQFQDSYPSAISKVSASQLYVRDCLVGAEEESVTNIGSVTVPPTTVKSLLETADPSQG